MLETTIISFCNIYIYCSCKSDSTSIRCGGWWVTVDDSPLLHEQMTSWHKISPRLLFPRHPKELVDSALQNTFVCGIYLSSSMLLVMVLVLCAAACCPSACISSINEGIKLVWTWTRSKTGQKEKEREVGINPKDPQYSKATFNYCILIRNGDGRMKDCWNVTLTSDISRCSGEDFLFSSYTFVDRDVVNFWSTGMAF